MPNGWFPQPKTLEPRRAFVSMGHRYGTTKSTFVVCPQRCATCDPHVPQGHHQRAEVCTTDVSLRVALLEGSAMDCRDGAELKEIRGFFREVLHGVQGEDRLGCFKGVHRGVCWGCPSRGFFRWVLWVITHFGGFSRSFHGIP